MTQRFKFYAHVCVTDHLRELYGKHFKRQLQADFARLVKEQQGQYPTLERYRPLSRAEAIAERLVPQPQATWYRLDGRAVRRLT